ncbi:primase-like DNA-binding domain-containing protein [Serratia bockelmannii]
MSFMETRDYQHVMNLTAFGQAVPQTLKEYEHTLLKLRTKQGIQTNLILSDGCEADWLPKCCAV